MEKLGVLKTTFEKINEVSRFEETRVFFPPNMSYRLFFQIVILFALPLLSGSDVILARREEACLS